MDRGWSEEKLESYAQSAFEELTEPGQISRRCPGCAGPTPPERTAPRAAGDGPVAAAGGAAP
jgi:hypothetical protein